MLPRAAWDNVAAYVATPEFALITPTVSKTFCNILERAPAWARAWAALGTLRSTHLAFAKCTLWCYREDRRCTKAERKVFSKEMDRAHEEQMRAMDQDGMGAWDAYRVKTREQEKRQSEADNWFGMPSAEPRVGTGGQWRFKGPGVSEEAARSNALAQRSSRELQADNSDSDSDSDSESDSGGYGFGDADSDSDEYSQSDAEEPDAVDSSVIESGAADVPESGAAESDAAAPDAHPRVLLATSQEAQYWRRLRGALEAWAARLPAAKAAAVRDFATRAAPGVFITAEAERKVLRKRHGKQDRTDYMGSKLISIATLTVTGILVRIVVVPECWCHGGHDSQLSQSFTCGFRRPGEQWVTPINYECEDRSFSKCTESRSSVARGDLLLDMARVLDVRALAVPDLVHLLFLVGGSHPVVGHIMYEPNIFSDWVAYVEAARRGKLKRRARSNVRTVGKEAPELIAWSHWSDKTCLKRPDLSAFGSLLVFNKYQHGPGEYTFSGQYPHKKSPDDRDQPVRMRSNPPTTATCPFGMRSKDDG